MAMAVSSSTAATLYIGHTPFIPTPTPLLNSVVFPTKPQRSNSSIRCSNDASSTPLETSSTEDPESLESSIEAPEGTPSIISSLNVERALRGIPITDVDHYGRLGLRRDCSNVQIFDAYKCKSEELLNQGLETEELNQELEKLTESYTILSTVEERRLYDWSLARTENPDKYVWPFEVDTSRAPLEEPPAQEPEDVGPTILVGYFMLGWLALSFVLSIVLNR